MDEQPRRRGRPPGSKNRPKDPEPKSGPSAPLADYGHADPGALVSRQLVLIDWAQQSVKARLAEVRDRGMEMPRAIAMDLREMSNALKTSLQAMAQADDLAEELSKRLSPEQLLDRALRKVEGQDLPTIRYAIKRLKAYADALIEARGDDVPDGEPATAAIAKLLNDS